MLLGGSLTLVHLQVFWLESNLSAFRSVLLLCNMQLNVWNDLAKAKRRWTEKERTKAPPSQEPRDGSQERA